MEGIVTITSYIVFVDLLHMCTHKFVCMYVFNKIMYYNKSLVCLISD